PRQLKQHRHRRLVVGTEYPVVRVLPAVIHEYGLDRSQGWDGVQMRAQQNTLASLARDAREQVGPVRAAVPAVLLHLQSQRAQLPRHPLGARALTSGRALDPAQRFEGAVELLTLRVGGAPHEPVSTTGSGPGWATGSAGPPRANAAPTNSRNSGAGRSGRDLNSGWYCEA